MVRLNHFLIVLFLVVLASVAQAQTSNAYLVGGIGGRTGTVADKTIGQVAVGGEWLAWKNLGAGAELGGVFGNDGFGTASFNGYFHFPPINHDKKLDPFATAGYTAAIQLFDASHAFNYGFGVNYWLLPHLGVRGEFRDLIPSGGNHYWTFRFGIALH